MKMKYAVLPAIRNPIFMNTYNAEYINVHSISSSVGLHVYMDYTECSHMGFNVWLYIRNYIGLRSPFMGSELIILTEDRPKDVFLQGTQTAGSCQYRSKGNNFCSKHSNGKIWNVT